MRFSHRACAIAALFLSGCQSFTAAQDQAATLTTISDTQRAYLADLLTRISGQQVTLTNQVFATSDRLVLERARRAGSQTDRLATGRNMDAPRNFRLVKNNNECILLDDDAIGTRHRLSGFVCEPI